MTDEAVKSYRYRTFGLHNFEKIPQIGRLSDEEIFAIKVVGSVLPFKANNYVTDELIDWDNYADDPIFRLTFPHRDMLSEDHFNEMAEALRAGLSKMEIKEIANKIRLELNPHPAGQQDLNVPQLGDVKLTGVQHKYRETMLFFPSQGQTCHAYCTFCFRWPQFVGMDELKFAMKEIEYVVDYLKEHPEVQDILFTGGDPMIMRTKVLRPYIEALLEADLPNLKTIRIGSKALGYWPYRFTTDADADELLDLFQRVTDSGKVLSYMAHFNHPVEMETPAVKEAIARIRTTGAQIRSQSPIMKHINDSADVWAKMWRNQVDLGIIPYYMFLARDTGAQDYFAVPLARAWNIYREAYQKVSGICRTVRGPSMSAGPGKVQVVGASEVNGEKVFTLQFLQGRNPDWVRKPFFAEFDEDAIWLDDLEPAFDSEFFYEEEYREMTETAVEDAV